MRYRLTVISVVVAALAAALVFALNRSDDSSVERGQPELFPEGSLGIVAAFTATARAGGAALDPTALATPSSTSVPSISTPLPETTSAPAAETTDSGPAETPATSPVLKLSSDEATAGEQISVEMSGAVPGESFEITVGGTTVEVPSSTADSVGTFTIEITISEGVTGDSLELVLVGSESGVTATTINISSEKPTVGVSPEDPEPGESITLSADGFEPGEAVTITVSGEEIGSGIAGQDGSFSMTTGLPELPESADGSQTLSVESAAGSTATTEFSAPAGSAGSGSSGTADEPIGAAGDGKNPINSIGQPENDSPVADDPIPAWLYMVIGTIAGWILVLTVWVYRLDRDREAQFKVLTNVISELVPNQDSESFNDDEVLDDDGTRAA